MRLRYIDGADWNDVAATIHYEWTQTHRIHARALSKIKNLKIKPFGITEQVRGAVNLLFQSIIKIIVYKKSETVAYRRQFRIFLK